MKALTLPARVSVSSLAMAFVLLCVDPVVASEVHRGGYALGDAKCGSGALAFPKLRSA